MPRPRLRRAIKRVRSRELLPTLRPVRQAAPQDYRGAWPHLSIWQGDADDTVAPEKAEVYAVEQIYALRRHRLELNPYWGFTLNDQFVSHPGPGMDLKYYVTNVLAIGLNGNWYGARLWKALPEPKLGAGRYLFPVGKYWLNVLHCPPRPERSKVLFNGIML